MQIVTNSPVQASGQPPLAAKPSKDNGSDTFAGLLAALAGVTGFLVQPVPPDPDTQAGTGPQSPGTSGLAAGSSPDPYGQAAAGPALSAPADTLTGAGLTPAGVSNDPSVASGPSVVSVPSGGAVAAAGSLPASGVSLVPVGQPQVTAGTVSPVPNGSGIAPAVATSSVSLPGSSQVAADPAVVPGPIAAVQTLVSAALAAEGSADQAAPKASQAVSSFGGYPPGVGVVVAGGAAAPTTPGVQAVPSAGSGPAAVSVSAAAPAVQTAALTGPVQGAGITAVQAAQAVLSPPAQGSVQGPALQTAGSGNTVSSPIGPAAPGTVSSSQPQSAPNGGSASSGGDGKGSDPGRTPVTNPLAGSPVPVFQLPTNTPAVSVANLPQQTAQTIQAYLNQGGRLPAQLQLQLDPPSLGKMTVHLALEAGTLSVAFVTASSHARDAVAASLPQMRELLSQNNVVVGHTGVYVGTQTGGRQSASGNPGGQPHQRPAIRFLAPVTAEEEGIQFQRPSGSSLLNILV